MVRKNGAQAHSPTMKNPFMTKGAQTSMAMNNLNFFSYDDVAEDGKERKHRGQSRLSIDNKEWNVIHFEAVGKIPNACAALIRMGDDDHLMTAVDEFG